MPNWNFHQNGAWQQGTPFKRQDGQWVSLLSDLGTAAFLHEGGEGTSGIIPETGNWVPDYDEAVEYTTEAARVGNGCIKLHMEYDWDYPDVGGMPAVKPIPNDPAWDDLYTRDPEYGGWGIPFWHGFSLGLPDYWQPDDEVEQVFEHHKEGGDPDSPGGTGKPVTCRITGNEMEFLNEWVEGGDVARIWSDPVTISAGNWYDIVMNIEWSNQDQANEGFLDIWVNGTQVMSHTGDNAPADDDRPRPPEYRIYKWEWRDGPSSTSERTYYFDEMRYADGDASYEDVVPGER